MNQEIGAIVRVAVPARRAPFLLAKHVPPGVWCHGIWYQRNGDCEMYLWLGSDSSEDQLSGDLIIEMLPNEPFALGCNGLARFIREMPMWTMLLESYLEELREQGLPIGNIEEVLISLNNDVRSLSRGLVALQLVPGILAVQSDELAISSARCGPTCVE